MTHYRSLATLPAEQYLGVPIPGITCDGDRDKHGCDSSRGHLPHVHSNTVGGLTVLKYGDWIMPQAGGPFAVAPDAEFRAYYEVPEATPVPSVVFETRTYADGVVATGPGPLPETSPASPAGTETVHAG